MRPCATPTQGASRTNGGNECCRVGRQFLEKHDETPTRWIVQKRHRGHEDSLGCGRAAYELCSRASKIAVSEAPWGIGERKSVANGRAAEIEDVVQRQFQLKDTPLNRDPLHVRFTPNCKVTTPLRNEHAFISREVERGQSLHIPAILRTLRREAEIKDVHWRARWNVSQRRT